ncbi:MAG: FecR family protein [Arachidicoccus sp.]|nr:FecR family protein [Arachidicoccus sp.]
MKINKHDYEYYITGKGDNLDEKEIASYLDKYNMTNDEDFPDNEVVLSEDISNRWLSLIHYKIFNQRIKRKKLSIVFTSVMGVAVLLVFGAVLFWKENKPNNINKSKTVISNMITKSNTTRNVEDIQLPDNSTVVLYPNSNIEYASDFLNGKRYIWLKGKALFSVTKDPSKPFTVYCNKTSTTALGTIFKIDESLKTVFISLIEGKILVQKTQREKDDMQYYLTAGNKIAYDIQGGNFTPVLSLANKEAQNMPKGKLNNNDAVSSPLISFSNIPMTQALDKLAKEYNVEIEYNSNDVKDINIIASISPHQPIVQILSNIAQMNHLALVIKNDKLFIIQKIIE